MITNRRASCPVEPRGENRPQSKEKRFLRSRTRPSEGVVVAMILDSGAPVESLEFRRDVDSGDTGGAHREGRLAGAVTGAKRGNEDSRNIRPSPAVFDPG